MNFERPFWLNRTAEDYDDSENPNTPADEILDGVQFLWEQNRSYCSINSFNESLMFGHWVRNASRDQLLQETDRIPEWCRDLSGISTIRNHPTALQAYVTGSSAQLIETLSLEEIQSSVMKVVRKFGSRIFKNVPEPINIKTSNWHNNPFTQGSYSFRTVESEFKQVFADDLAEPIQNAENKPIICFAGEATHPRYYSHAHGAFDTGLREAERIHSFYQNRNNKNRRADANNAGQNLDCSSVIVYTILGIIYVFGNFRY